MSGTEKQGIYESKEEISFKIYTDSGVNFKINLCSLVGISAIANCLLCYAEVPLKKFLSLRDIDSNIPMLTEDSDGCDHLNVKLSYLQWVGYRLVVIEFSPQTITKRKAQINKAYFYSL